MSGFNIAELLPFYLDETDEHITALNDALLRLEDDPADNKSLAEAFRIFHSIKGASVVMGFDSVNRLTHHLESLFEQLRSHKRTLDRPVLDLTFRCLDELRDYHQNLRSEGQSQVDLSGLTEEVLRALTLTEAPAPSVVAKPLPVPSSKADLEPEPAIVGNVRATIVFEPNLPLADMKARLVLSRLGSRATVLSSRPSLEQLDVIESIQELVIELSTDCDASELKSLADVSGVAQVKIVQLDEGTTSLGATSTRDVAPSNSVEQPSVPSETSVEDQPVSASPSDESQDPLEGVAAPASASAPVVPPPKSGSQERETVPDTVQARTSESRRPKVAETIRVESDRLDYLMNLAGELVINKARFVEIARGLNDLFRRSNAEALALDTEERLESISRSLESVVTSPGRSPSQAVGAQLDGDATLERWTGHIKRIRDNFTEIQSELDRLRLGRDQVKALSDAIHSLGRVTDGLQKGVLETRMVPIGPLFERFRRVIRDLSLVSGKEVLLHISGEKTELDKRMIDELSDPLIHMVRNSVDHGLEPPSERESSGKSRAGTISLQASHRGNSVVITVSDDGRGIDCERIRRKIVAKGLVSPKEAEELSERRLISYIWHPGLSTAETITEISGRGVGMDIVKNRIENLSGMVDVRTTPGHGTTFTIRLPLTLAIMSSLLVQIFDEVYAIPLDHIEEIVEVDRRKIYKVQGLRTIEIRKKIIPLVFLSDLFFWGDSDGSASSERPISRAVDQLADGIHVVVVQNGETTIGLAVNQLIGMQEVVLKSLEKNFQAVSGLSGASILGDGRVSLILDVDALVNMSIQSHSTHRSSRRAFSHA